MRRSGIESLICWRVDRLIFGGDLLEKISLNPFAMIPPKMCIVIEKDRQWLYCLAAFTVFVEKKTPQNGVFVSCKHTHV